MYTVEFYFADSNLPYDKYVVYFPSCDKLAINSSFTRFMWTLHTAQAEHWVKLETVASFKRMREFSSLGTEWLVNALRELSQEVELDESGVMVRRKSEVTEPKGQFERSIYAVSTHVPEYR